MTNIELQLELLSAYVDGEATPDQRRQVEAWLSDDPELRQAHRDLLELGALMRSVAAPPAPAGFQERVLARLQTEARPAAPPRAAWAAAPRIAAALVTVAAAAILAVVLTPRLGGPPRERLVATSPDSPPDETALVEKAERLDNQGPAPTGAVFMSLFDVVIKESAYKRGVFDQVLNQAGIELEKGLTVDEQMEQAIFGNRMLGRLDPVPPTQSGEDAQERPLAKLQLLYVVAGGRQFDEVYQGFEQMLRDEVQGLRMDIALTDQDKMLFEKLDRAHDLMIAQAGESPALGVARRLLISVALESRLSRQLSALAAPAAAGLLAGGGRSTAPAANLLPAQPGLAQALGAMEAEEFQLVIVLRVVPD